MLELLLPVLRPDGRLCFDAREQRKLADDELWARFNAEQAGSAPLTASRKS